MFFAVKSWNFLGLICLLFAGRDFKNCSTGMAGTRVKVTRITVRAFTRFRVLSYFCFLRGTLLILETVRSRLLFLVKELVTFQQFVGCH